MHIAILGEARRRATDAVPLCDLARGQRDNFLADPMQGDRPHTLNKIMSDKPTAPPAENAASAAAENVAAKAAAAPKALPEQNAAFRMMGRSIATAQGAKMRIEDIGTNCIAQAFLASVFLLAIG